MQHDDAIWSVISQGFCSFKAKIRDDVGHAGAKAEAFCRNPHNSTGICSRVNCPLANSQYATIIEKDDQLYLFMKTVERAHTPKRLWEKILLPNNFKDALGVINENLQWWDRKVVLKCKHRLLRLKQVLIRKRRLEARGVPKIVGIKKKEEKQLLKKEAKAEKAAKVFTSTEKHLLKLLPTRTLDDIDLTDEDITKLLEDTTKKDKKVQEELEEIADTDLVPYDVDSDTESGSEEEDEEDEEDEESEGDAATGKRKHIRVGQPMRKMRRVEIEEEKELSTLRKSMLDADKW